MNAGDRFARLTVISTGPRMSLCRCDCGIEKNISNRYLKIGHTRSCGCLIADKARLSAKRHGETCKGVVTPEYKTWAGMISRCHGRNPHKNYQRLGISVCERWRNSFEAFVQDVGRRPSLAHSLDRYPNPSGNYEPSNVRWATRSEQSNNKINTFFVEFLGSRMTLRALSKASGLPWRVLYYRVIVRRMPIEIAASAPLSTAWGLLKLLPESRVGQ
jgi:hypothetical protein